MIDEKLVLSLITTDLKISRVSKENLLIRILSMVGTKKSEEDLFDSSLRRLP